MNNKRYDIYIGFHNSNKESFLKRLIEFCESEKIDFSFTKQKGGFILSDGKYIAEDSLRISIIGDYSKEDIKEFADVVRKDYKQESILVNIKRIDVEYR